MSDELTEFPTKLNPLPAETKAEAREKRRARREFRAIFTPFVKAMREAITGYLGMRKQGVSREDAIKGLEVVLRDVWPKQVTKFPANCDACDDTGYVEKICAPYVRCERQTCQRKGDEFQHRYVVLCHCDKGQAMARAQVRKYAEPEVGIGKVGKPKKSWQRLGI